MDERRGEGKDIGKARDAESTYRRLGWRTRFEVERLAYKKQPHPDLRVATIAVGWTQAVLRRPWWQMLVFVAIGGVLGGVLREGIDRVADNNENGFPEGMLFGIAIVSTIFLTERWKARRIARANRHVLETTEDFDEPS